MSKNSKRCWHPGCTEKGMKCFIPSALTDGGDENSRYCWEHAADNGFCYGCGLFAAGPESFEFGHYRGLCDNCADEVRANEEWEDEAEYFYP